MGEHSFWDHWKRGVQSLALLAAVGGMIAFMAALLTGLIMVPLDLLGADLEDHALFMIWIAVLIVIGPATFSNMADQNEGSFMIMMSWPSTKPTRTPDD